MVNLYTIDSATGQFGKKAYRAAGENASWALNGNVLTISGSSAINVDPEAYHGSPISSTYGWSPYSPSDNAWAPIRNSVKKIVIDKGITGIPERTFAYFDALEEVQIADGMKNIGKEAFFDCGALRKITIPASVTSIGDDILWTGAYWTYDESHVVYATIYAP